MALQLATITGNVKLPDGTTPAFGTVVFSISGWAKDAPHIFAPDPVEVSVAPNGDISAQLQSTSDKYVLYEVTLRYRRNLAAAEVSLSLGYIEVGFLSSYVLADLLPVPVSAANAVKELSFKRGDTLSIGAIITTRFGHPQNLETHTVEADLKGPDDVRRPLVVTVDTDPSTGRIWLSMDAEDSAELPLGEHSLDVKRTNSEGMVRHTPTISVSIREEITQ